MFGRRKITLPLPLNIQQEHLTFFQSFQIYYTDPTKIQKLKNCFVANNGLVLKFGFLKNRSGFNLLGAKDNTFYLQFWRTTLEEFLVSRFGKSLKNRRIKDKTLTVIHTKWFNYAFWITDSLPRLIELKKNMNSRTFELIEPTFYNENAFVKESLKAFPNQRFELEKGEHLFVENLLFIPTRKWSFSFDPILLKQAKEYLVTKASEFCSRNNFPQKIYVSRAKRQIRGIENENELLPVLSENGYSVIEFENFTFWEQVKMMSNATHFCSIHGAGFANIMFMMEGSFVTELINQEYAMKEYKMQYYRLTSCLNLNYTYVFGKVENLNKSLKYGKNSDQKESDFLVNCNINIELNELMKVFKQIN